MSPAQIKLPPFWPKDPAVWFAQIEAQFLTRGITVSKTKFNHVVSCLAPEYATKVRDLLLEPPAEQPYETLKAQMTKRTSASEQHQIQELLSAEELGDRTPSQMLRRIQQLLGDMAGCYITKGAVSAETPGKRQNGTDPLSGRPWHRPAGTAGRLYSRSNPPF